MDDFLSRLARSALALAPEVRPLIPPVYAADPVPPALEVVDEETIVTRAATPPEPPASVNRQRHEAGVAPSVAPAPLAAPPRVSAIVEPELSEPHETLPQPSGVFSDQRDVPPQPREVLETLRVAPALPGEQTVPPTAATTASDERPAVPTVGERVSATPVVRRPNAIPVVPTVRERPGAIPEVPTVTPSDARPAREPGAPSDAVELSAVAGADAGAPPGEISAATQAVRISRELRERAAPRPPRPARATNVRVVERGRPEEPPREPGLDVADVHVHVAHRAVAPLATAAAEVEAAAEPTVAPVVRITIGRVEVRAVMPAAPTPRPAPTRAKPALALDDYLKQQSGRPR